MRFSYQFRTLCGTVYRGGNVIFTPDGSSLLSPVGNRVSVFDLANNETYTMPFESRKDVAQIALSPDGNVLLVIDVDGHALSVGFRRRVVHHRFNFKAPVKSAVFSPNGKFIAVTHGKHVQVWKSPSAERVFTPFEIHRTYTGQYDDTTFVRWSQDSCYFVVGSKDLSCRVFSLDPIPDFTPVTLTGHRERVVGCFFAAPAQFDLSQNAARLETSLYTISYDGALIVWNRLDNQINNTQGNDEQGGGHRVKKRKVLSKYQWAIEAKHFFKQDGAKVLCVDYNRHTRILVVGFSNGVFGLYEMPDFTTIHTLSISQKKIGTVAINNSGEWLAFGSAQYGQLLVWEWQSETHVLKQQGHTYDMNALAHSPDGQLIVTGGDDGKVKVWKTTTGFCTVTFAEHVGAVTALAFASNGRAVFSASRDGTVRAFDLTRYRNFRTFTSPEPVQFQSLALESSGEVVCAGSLDTFEVFVWSSQTGRLLEILAGHEGPISRLQFSPTQAILASSSWDKTVKFWEVYKSTAPIESLGHDSEVVAFCYSPDGFTLCSSTLKGELLFWNVQEGRQTGSIEGRRDIAGGRLRDDKISANNNASGKCFTSVCFSADGTCVLAGGESKFVCIYDRTELVLLKKFEISVNRSMDGILDKLNSKFANTFDIDDSEASDDDARMGNDLPGVRKGDLAKRSTTLRARTKAVEFSPTGRAWAAASTEGLLVYALDDGMVFDPIHLDVDITPQTVRKLTKEGETQKSLIVALRLNEELVLQESMEAVVVKDIELLTRSLPSVYMDRLLMISAKMMEKSRHVHFYLLWCRYIFDNHGRYIKQHIAKFLHVLQFVQKSVRVAAGDVSKISSENRFMLDYMHTLASQQQTGALPPTPSCS